MKAYNQMMLLEYQTKFRRRITTEKYITGLGATPDQAQKIIKASEAMNVSPKF